MLSSQATALGLSTPGKPASVTVIIEELSEQPDTPSIIYSKL